MLAPEYFDRVDPFRDWPRDPIAPRLVRLVDPTFRDHTFDRRHDQILPTGLATSCGNSSPVTEQSPTQSSTQEHPPMGGLHCDRREQGETENGCARGDCSVRRASFSPKPGCYPAKGSAELPLGAY